jgi:hypothetical protein
MNDPTPRPSRRDQTRQYKENPPAAGVYLIRNLVTQRIVLKASLNLEGAMNRDRFELRMGKHRDATLQADCKRLGEAALRFEVVETLKPPTDPDADPAEALALALALWQEELLSKEVPK